MYGIYMRLTKIGTLSALSFFVHSATAQTVDFAKQKSADSRLMVVQKAPRAANRYRAEERVNNQVIDRNFFTPENLAAAYNEGAFLLQYLEPNTESGETSKIRVTAPKSFRSKAEYDNHLAAGGAKLSNCLTSVKGNMICLAEIPEAARYIPASGGKVRKAMMVRDFIMMTTTTGQLFFYRVQGSFTAPSAGLYQLNVPSPIDQEILFQDIARLYLAPRFESGVLGINGSLGGRPFGSKLWAFNGKGSDLDLKKRRFNRALVLREEDPNFIMANDGSYFRSRSYDEIFVELAPFSWDIGSLGSVIGLDKRVTLKLRTADLEER